MTDLIRAKSFVNKLDFIQMKPDELAHYGVIGMKWGKRKDRAGSSSRTPKEPRKVRFKNSETGATTKKKYPRKASTDHVQSRELKSKKTNELSNDDIQKIVDRLQKESKLKQLDPSNIARGKKIALGVVAGLGTATALYNFGVSPLGQKTVGKSAKAIINTPLGKKAVANGAKIVEVMLKKIL